PLEAASAGKPILMGPQMQNFRAITRTFLGKQAARQVSNVEALQSTLKELLEHPQERDRLGKAAREVVDANLGAVERTLEMLCQHPSMAEHLKP
ncbi:MAG: glycosyltransferase, partial [Verrucomicrobiota bacterium]